MLNNDFQGDQTIVNLHLGYVYSWSTSASVQLWILLMTGHYNCLWFVVSDVMLNRFSQDMKWNENDTKTRTRHSDSGLSLCLSHTHTHTHTHTLTHSLSTELRHKNTASTPQSVSLSGVCLYFLCTPWHAHVCAWVCFINPRGESSDRGGGVAVPQWQKENRRRKRALVVLKAVEIHWAANIPILSSTAWKDRKQQIVSINTL